MSFYYEREKVEKDEYVFIFGVVKEDNKLWLGAGIFKFCARVGVKW